jgi:hypothetical protein
MPLNTQVEQFAARVRADPLLGECCMPTHVIVRKQKLFVRLSFFVFVLFSSRYHLADCCTTACPIISDRIRLFVCLVDSTRFECLRVQHVHHELAQ